MKKRFGYGMFFILLMLCMCAEPPMKKRKRFDFYRSFERWVEHELFIDQVLERYHFQLDGSKLRYVANSQYVGSSIELRNPLYDHLLVYRDGERIVLDYTDLNQIGVLIIDPEKRSLEYFSDQERPQFPIRLPSIVHWFIEMKTATIRGNDFPHALFGFQCRIDKDAEEELSKLGYGIRGNKIISPDGMVFLLKRKSFEKAHVYMKQNALRCNVVTADGQMDEDFFIFLRKEWCER